MVLRPKGPPGDDGSRTTCCRPARGRSATDSRQPSLAPWDRPSRPGLRSISRGWRSATSASRSARPGCACGARPAGTSRSRWGRGPGD